MAVVEAITFGLEKAKIFAGETVKKGVESLREISEIEVKEFAQKQIEEVPNCGDAVKVKLNEIKNLTPKQLRENMEENLENFKNNVDNDEGIKVKEGLTDEEKQKIKKETSWSDEIINTIRLTEEYEIYKNADLIESEIGGKKCLIRNDIDWNQLDEKGRTNYERVKKGAAPLDRNGNSIELHHIGQNVDSPLAELTFEEHRCGGNDTILHDKSIETEIHGEGNKWDNERQTHWKNRS